MLLVELFETCPVAIGVREVRGDDIVHVEDNHQAAALFGKTPEEVRGRTEAELGIPRDQIVRAIARFRAARESGKPATVAFNVEGARGTRTLEGTVVVLHQSVGER